MSQRFKKAMHARLDLQEGSDEVTGVGARRREEGVHTFSPQRINNPPNIGITYTEVVTYTSRGKAFPL